MITEIAISEAFAKLRRNRAEYHNAAERAIFKKIQYENSRGNMITTGEITGKNETERDANARSKLMEEYQAMIEAEHAERAARLYLDQALTEWEYCKLLLRLAEIETRADAGYEAK